MNAIKTARRRITRSLGASLLVGVCAIAIPAAASASPNLAPVIADSGSGSASDQAPAPPAPPTGLVDRHAQQINPPKDGFAPIQGGAPEPTFASSSPATGDGFDWADAALGAGAALALVALSGIGLLTARKRTAIAPSVSTG
jgi:hypothetical protein